MCFEFSHVPVLHTCLITSLENLLLVASLMLCCFNEEERAVVCVVLGVVVIVPVLCQFWLCIGTW